MAWWIPLAASAVGAIATARAGRRNIRFAQQEAQRAFEERQEQRRILNEQMDVYKSQKFINPFAENVFEDLTVNQQQAQFQAQQGAQQRANIMESLRSSAGGSGIAGLAQTLANQGQLQAQQISASIGQQEAANQRLAAQGELNVQRGEEALQRMNVDRESTILGMRFGQATGANEAYAQAQKNIMGARTSALSANTEALTNVVSTLGRTDFKNKKYNYNS
jgi:hypothetical protein|tara:strand:+ start:2022 stop:2684 length:663 start_codon:yes stop_codon:yes gene_type:complete